MARTVKIKPEFFRDDSLAELNPALRVFFIGLWTISTRDARIVASVKEIAGAILFGQESQCVEMLDILARNGFIRMQGQDTLQIEIPRLDRWCVATGRYDNGANGSSRRARQRNAMPKWADRDAIREIYKEARRRKLAGEDVHVDHDIPLAGKNVSGLHVHFNLKIIPAVDNLKKSNKFGGDE